MDFKITLACFTKDVWYKNFFHLAPADSYFKYNGSRHKHTYFCY